MLSGKSGRRARRSIVALIAAMALLAIPIGAQGGVDVNVKEPLEGLAFSNPCTGEDMVHTGGNLHVLITFTENDNHVSGKVHFQPQAATLEGVDSGDAYIGTGVTQETFTAAKGETLTFVNNFRIIGKGATPNWIVHAVAHVTVNANGELAVEFDDEPTFSCK